MSHALTAAPPAAWRVLVPGGFVVLWSTGFFIGKLGLAFAPPFTILFLRFALAALLMAAAALPLRSAWPRSPRQAAHLAVVGVLLQTVYLGGCYAAMAAGLPAGITALIVGLQPILIATVVGPLLGERVGPKHWLGLALGFLGVALVLWDKLDIAGLESWGVLFALAGLLGITAATLYQKRFCGAGDLITGTAIQYAAAALTTLPIVLVLGWGPVHWTGSFIFSLAWLTFALSIGRGHLAALAHPAGRRLQGREPLLSDPARGGAGELSSPERDPGGAGPAGHGADGRRRRPGQSGLSQWSHRSSIPISSAPAS